MAIYNLTVEPEQGTNCAEKYEYNAREGKYSKGERGEELIYKNSFNLPLFAKDSPSLFWEENFKNSSAYESSYIKIEFSLPHELNHKENIELSEKFASELLGNKYVYSLAIHDKLNTEKTLQNIHCHIIFYDRPLDGIERNAETFFKKANRTNPEKGGVKKEGKWRKLKGIYEIRQTWERVCNEKLKEKGIELIDSRSLKKQRESALANGDFVKAELLDRDPININGKLLRKPENERTEDEKETISKFELAKNVTKLKTREYKLKIDNYAQENEEARKRFLNIVSEEYGLNTGEEKAPSVFVVENEMKTAKEVFDNAVEIETLKELLGKKLNKIEYNLEPDRLREIVIEQLTQGEHKKKIERYNLMKEYEEIAHDDDFADYKREYNELEKYINSFKLPYMNEKILAKEGYIRDKYVQKREELTKEISLLRNNKYQLKHIESVEDKELLIYIKELQQIIKELRERKPNIDEKVLEQKKKIDFEKIKIDLCQKLSNNRYLSIKESLEPYRKEYEKHKKLEEEYTGTKTSYAYSILYRNYDEAKNKYIGAKQTVTEFEIRHNIKEKVDEVINKERAILKELRIKQDDINGRIKLAADKIRIIKEYRKEVSKDYFEIDKLKEKMDHAITIRERFKVSAEILELKDRLETRKNTLLLAKDVGEIEEKAKDILTNRKYSKNINRLEELNKNFPIGKEREKEEIIRYINSLDTIEFNTKLKEKTKELIAKDLDEIEGIDINLRALDEIDLDLNSPENLLSKDREKWIEDIKNELTELSTRKEDLDVEIQLLEKQCDIKSIKEKVLNEETNGTYNSLKAKRNKLKDDIEEAEKYIKDEERSSSGNYKKVFVLPGLEKELEKITVALKDLEENYIIPSEAIIKMTEKTQKELGKLKVERNNLNKEARVLSKEFYILREKKGFEGFRRERNSNFINLLLGKLKTRKKGGKEQGGAGYFKAKIFRDDEERDRD